MPELEIKDKNNNTSGKITVSDEIFGLKIESDILHSSVVNYLANQRQGTHATKTKGLVSGGGKKPWKQKHTGRARSGSIRSPLWRKGGTIFGPQPRDYSYSMPKQSKRLALKTALSAKFADGEITFIEDLPLDKPKTKDMASILKNLGLNGKTVLLVVPEDNNIVKLSARNLPAVSVIRAADLNAYNVIIHDMVLITKKAAESIEGLVA